MQNLYQGLHFWLGPVYFFDIDLNHTYSLNFNIILQQDLKKVIMKMLLIDVYSAFFHLTALAVFADLQQLEKKASQELVRECHLD